MDQTLKKFGGHTARGGSHGQREPRRRRLWSDQRGLETVEYAILLGLLAGGVIVAVIAVGEWTSGQYTTVAAAVSPAPGGGPPGGGPWGPGGPGGGEPPSPPPGQQH